ncbi:phosphatase PAP2 family protein [Niallia sp. XMNu-256]|uniref:phosphatase PAP2 family protein n=1 Tax=Niallia sp. XMNu-256 TaxID=3082444 RepID=UPI0030CC70B7
MAKTTKWMTLLLIIAVVTSVFLIVGVIKSGAELGFDHALNQWVLSIFTEGSHPIFQVITKLGDTIGIAIVVFIILVWLGVKKRDFTGMVILVLAVALGNEMSKWLKEVVGRERPETAGAAESLSFPSGHAMVGLILYFILSYLLISTSKSLTLKWGIAIISFIIVLLIGISRIVLQDHHPTDVLGGFALGIIWSILWVTLYNVVYSRLGARRMKSREE